MTKNASQEIYFRKFFLKKAEAKERVLKKPEMEE